MPRRRCCRWRIKYPEELWGIEDPRIVWLDELGAYAITYTASRNAPLVALALTKDFVSFDNAGRSCRRRTRTPRFSHEVRRPLGDPPPRAELARFQGQHLALLFA